MVARDNRLMYPFMLLTHNTYAPIIHLLSSPYLPLGTPYVPLHDRYMTLTSLMCFRPLFEQSNRHEINAVVYFENTLYLIIAA